MKKLMSILLLGLLLLALTACGDNAGSTDEEKNSVGETVSDGMETENANSELTSQEEDEVYGSYQSETITRDGKRVTIYYDPEYIKASKRSAIESAASFTSAEGLKMVFNFRLSTYETAEVYFDTVYQKNLAEQGLNQDYVMNPMETTEIGGNQYKTCVISYNARIVEMEKGVEYTTEQLLQLPYTLEARQQQFKAIQVSEDVMVECTISVGEAEEILQHIKFVVE